MAGSPAIPPPTDEEMRSGIFWVTQCIALGGYPDADKGRDLLKQGVSHVLNVSQVPNRLTSGPEGFQEVLSRPITDFQQFSDDAVVECLDHMYRMLLVPGSRLYVHCAAGRNRSPNILWLFLIACGMDPAEAVERIGRRSLDAAPGDPRFADAASVRLAQEYGHARFLPFRRPEALALP